MADELQAQAGDIDQHQQAVESTTDSPDTQTNGTNPMAEYEAMLAEALSAHQTEEEEHGDEPAESDEDGDDSDADSEGEEQISEEGDPQGDAEKGDEQEQKVPDRFRFKSDEDKAVAALAKAENISLLEAAERYKALQNPTKREDAETAADGDRNNEDTGSESVKSVTDAMTQLRQQRKEAFDMLDLDKVEELDGQIDDLRDKLTDLKIAESQAKFENRAKQEQSIAEAEARSLQFYPDLKKPDSELNAEYWRLHDSMKGLEDPILERPDSAWIIAKQAAKNLGIPMADTQKAPAKKSVKTRPVQPAGGNASTTVPTQGSSRIDQAVEEIGSEYDYDQLVNSLLGKTR